MCALSQEIRSNVSVANQAKLQLDSGNVYDSSMEIKDVTLEDAGKYKVIAKNDIGECSASISLNFDSKFLQLATYSGTLSVLFGR